MQNVRRTTRNRRGSSVVETKSTVSSPQPGVPFERIARRILGVHYSLSLVICGDTLARRLYTQYRKKAYKPNVLSFPLSKNEGEIILNIRKAEREARAEGISTQKRLAFLFVHACLHLKGHDHSDAMDALEHKHMRLSGF